MNPRSAQFLWSYRHDLSESLPWASLPRKHVHLLLWHQSCVLERWRRESMNQCSPVASPKKIMTKEETFFQLSHWLSPHNHPSHYDENSWPFRMCYNLEQPWKWPASYQHTVPSGPSVSRTNTGKDLYHSHRTALGWHLPAPHQHPASTMWILLMWISKTNKQSIIKGPVRFKIN